MLEITGGVEDYIIEYEDYRQYTNPPPYLTNGFPIALNNITTSTDTDRPPIILDITEPNSLEFCVNVAVNSGNGWVKITVRDSATLSQEFIIWLYVKQTLF